MIECFIESDFWSNSYNEIGIISAHDLEGSVR